MISGVEGVEAHGTRVRVVGDGHANGIAVDGCDVQVYAGGGTDYVVRYDYLALGCARTSKFDGGPGSDQLYGADKSTDVLVGGPGRDSADGRGGTDTCRAEVTRHCEES